MIKTRYGIITTDETGLWTKYHKTVDETKHKFHNYEGYGFSTNEIRQMKENTVNKIILTVKKPDGTEKAIITTMETLLKKGIKWYNQKEQDQQLILPESEFVTRGD